jgi:hypothetical protein
MENMFDENKRVDKNLKISYICIILTISFVNKNF